ncbi:MAG: HEAT repeat domain-containing protein [Nitrospiraceae bacterium]
MRRLSEQGQVNPTIALLLVSLIIAGVWIWKRLPPDVQDMIVEQAVPLAALAAVVLAGVWTVVRRVRHRKHIRQEREKLLARFQRETSPEKRFDLACELIELNDYRLDGLEAVGKDFLEIFSRALKTAVGDKQHRVRGLAASYLSVVQDPSVVPILMTVLDDDHWWVRSQAALGLGRMRAKEAKAKLAEMATEDWDQTVRSRCREALERIE